MAEEIIIADDATPAAPKRRYAVLRAIGMGLLAILLLIAAAVWMLDTAPGHRLIIDQISKVAPSSGLRIRIGRIDGSIWNKARIRDLRLYDTQGLFFEAPEVDLDWRPAAWIANKLWIRRAASDLVILHRMPRLRPTTKKGPLLPGFDIHVGGLAIKKLRLEPAVAGSLQSAKIDAEADIHGGRALLRLSASTTARDKLRLLFDAEPDRNRFDIDAKIDGPADGVISRLAGWKRPVDGLISGSGSWAAWKGRATLDIGNLRLVELGLAARSGKYSLNGQLSPSSLLSGKMQRLTAPSIRIDGSATLANRKLDGNIAVKTPEIEIATSGAVDLAQNSFEGVIVNAKLLKPQALFPNMTGRNIRLNAHFDGPIATAAYRYSLTADHVAFDESGFDIVRADGKGALSSPPVKLPIRLTARRVTGIGDVAGGILANVKIDGLLRITAANILGDNLAFSSDKLCGKLSLKLDLRTGVYDVALSGKLLRYYIPGVGIVDVNSELSVVPGKGGKGTIVAGRGRAWVRRFDNAFLRSLAGGLPQIDTHLTRTPDGIMHFDKLLLTGPDIRITGSGMRRRDGSFYFKGKGVQRQYGPIELTLDGDISRPKIDLLLASPLNALGLSNVAVKLNPSAQGFDYTAAGASLLGPFTSAGAILLPSGQPATIAVQTIAVSGATGSGDLRADPGGFTGQIALAGGDIVGPMTFSIEEGIQKIEAHLSAQKATLALARPISVNRGRIDGSVFLRPEGPQIDGTALVFGGSSSGISLGRGRIELHMKAGAGTLSANLSGSRGRGFQLATVTRFTPDSFNVTAEGAIDRRPVKLDTPAILRRDGDSWQLEPTALSFNGGKATISGRFGGAATEFKAGVQGMPLSVLDIFYPSLGLSGIATGDVDYRILRGGRLPTGRANLRIKGLSRSGLVLTSRPADVAVAAVLTENVAAARAVVSSGGSVIGQAQARVTNLPADGMLPDRLRAGGLFAQLRYNGPADTLWRLIGVETIDLSGPIAIGADITGSLANPLIRGSLRSTQARLESAITGTVINNIAAQGRFDGSRLLIDKLGGQTKGGGTIKGRATFDFAGGKGFAMDVAIDADNAQLLNRDDIAATITGPLTMKSDGGGGGVIAGDVKLTRGRFTLGRASAVSTIPIFKTTELNRPADDGEPVRVSPWRLNIHVNARNQLAVTGLGLDSEWRADLDLGGAVDNPAITGRADLVRGGYEFAGRRFDLDRGSIRFLGETPPDPVLDIVAKATLNSVSATITVGGTGLRPEISFTSIPALPEDELLSRLLFGTSITNLSAPEALQLAAAVGSLRGGGGGLNPINAVRRVAGLDRLRILPADPTIGTGTAVAAGKYIGRRTYVEVISDGQGYSATRVEFQITRWLSLLSSISTIGRQSASVKVSKDY